MISSPLLNLSAVAALVPVALAAYRGSSERPGPVFWAAMLVAVAGPTALIVPELMRAAWDSGFSLALWVTIAASIWIFALISLLSLQAWRLAPLLVPYLILLSLLALAWSGVSSATVLAAEADFWLRFHIAASVGTYALCTIAATAGVAVYLKERELKLKLSSRLGRLLPSVADAERLQFKLLAFAELVLFLGIVSGMARGYLVDGHLLSLDHKTLLAVLAFALIAVLLLIQWRSGLYARQAARAVMIAYLLLTLAYPGVKFILDVIIA
ncbi:cytochrome c biogenesis protein CcsA [Denitrobaculum tricleocarpae]|uniref:Cytochrome c assembly protein domain-containing protein n=1 Tax=Denitrobaculum tricleocarpae TaxID=2591009 RepID=A0A545TPP0_9PROT|nr:cytochrome c biogenesis protein CcsA [Denitrobaculum tricleocarpae]TQV79192.1 hypothetical protein FKG95_16145 [Denitrobaculum tricleocarpae]